VLKPTIFVPPYRSALSKFMLWLRLSATAGIAMLCSCTTSSDLPAKQPPELAHPQNHIYVTSGGLDVDCYRDLGQISLNETYAQSIVESADSLAEQMRTLARREYPAKVDAIINVRERQNEAGTAVEISGKAVQLQNHETVACAARGMPAVLDSASAAAGGGIVGTVVGGLAESGGSVYGAESGGAMGATAGAAMELAKHRQQVVAQEAFIGDRLKQQQTEITRLYQKLAKLIGQQCDSEELSEQDCEKRIVAVQTEIADVGAVQTSASTKSGGSHSNGASAEFSMLNRIQQQQEIINQLQRRIAQSEQDVDNK
jgi:hypothetical protein